MARVLETISKSYKRWRRRQSTSNAYSRDFAWFMYFAFKPYGQIVKTSKYPVNDGLPSEHIKNINVKTQYWMTFFKENLL